MRYLLLAAAAGVRGEDLETAREDARRLKALAAAAAGPRYDAARDLLCGLAGAMDPDRQAPAWGTACDVSPEDTRDA